MKHGLGLRRHHGVALPIVLIMLVVLAFAGLLVAASLAVAPSAPGSYWIALQADWGFGATTQAFVIDVRA